MDNRDCKACIIQTENYKRDIDEKIQLYIRSLPEELKTEKKEYDRRVFICEACDDNMYGMCRYSGSFIETRAANSSQHCPAPGKPKW